MVNDLNTIQLEAHNQVEERSRRASAPRRTITEYGCHIAQKVFLGLQ